MPIEVYFEGRKKVNAKIGSFEILTDQSLNAGGDGTAPEPFTLFLSSLATCAGIYVKSFCDQRGIPSRDISLSMDYEFDPVAKIMGKMMISINVPPDFPEKYESAVINAASLCAVKRHLKESIKVEITVSRQ
jgi:putative redox protein